MEASPKEEDCGSIDENDCPHWYPMWIKVQRWPVTGEFWSSINTKTFFRVHELDVCYIPMYSSAPWEAHSVHSSRPSTQPSRRNGAKWVVTIEVWKDIKSKCLASGGTSVVIVWGLFWLDSCACCDLFKFGWMLTDFEEDKYQGFIWQVYHDSTRRH